MPIEIIRQDITKIKCDAIVNPTNSKLIGYSGIDYLVHKLGGAKLEEECHNIGYVDDFKAVITNAYNLPAKYIIHAVGPVWRGGDFKEEEKLVDTYNAVLNLAKDKHLKNIAIPLISSGSYGFPKDRVLMIALNVIGEFLVENDINVYLVVYDDESYRLSSALFKDIKEYIDDNTVIKKKSRRASVYDAPYMECSYISKKQCDKELSIDDFVDEQDDSFAETLFKYIDDRGLSDPEVYKRANVSRKTFSKIRSDEDYHPSRNTIIALAIALELNLEDTNILLSKSGYTLTKSSKFDLIVMYFIENENFNLFEINEALLNFKQPLIGC